jgi:hypothetical protein
VQEVRATSLSLPHGLQEVRQERAVFEFDTVPLPKNGKLLTFTTVHNLPPDFNVAKLSLGIVELENGMRITGQLKIPEPEDRHAGRESRDRPRGRIQQELRDGVLPGMMLMSIGDQVEGRNFTRSWCQSLTEEIGDGPRNIVMRDLGHWTDTESARNLRGQGRFRRWRVSFHQPAPVLFHSRMRNRRFSTLCDNLSLFGELLERCRIPRASRFFLMTGGFGTSDSGFERAFAEQVKRSVNQIFHGDRLNGVRSLSGCGIGLTPSGDDFIAGLLIGLNLRGEGFRGLVNQVFAAAQTKNIFSSSFLDLARQGLLFGRMKDLILALLHGGQRGRAQFSREVVRHRREFRGRLGNGLPDDDAP